MATRTRRTAGDGGLYKRADGMWVGAVDLGFIAGKRTRKTVSSKDRGTALKKLRELRRTLDDHGAVPAATTTVATFMARWLQEVARPRLRPKTFEGYETTVRQHILPTVGHRRLSQLAPQHVRDMHLALRKPGKLANGKDRPPVAEATILKAHRVLAKALADAMREGLVVRNVATLVDAPRKGPSGRSGLTSPQAQLLLRTMQEDPMCSRWFAALYTGARQGELLGLEWDRVTDVLDLSWQLQRITYSHGCLDAAGAITCGRKTGGGCPRRHLDLPRNFEHRTIAADSNLILARPKTAAGTRLVVMAEPLRMVMDRYREGLGGDPTGLVWRDARGEAIRPRDDLRAWHSALEAAGLSPVPLHSARHTTATLLLESGVDAHVISSILGHSDIVVTRGYQHVDLTLQRQAMQALTGHLAS